MPNTPTNTPKTTEPLAKFHARILSNGRIAIPENTRLRYGFGKGDWVELLIRKVQLEGGPILGRGHFFGRVTNKGLITLPKGLRTELGLKEKEIIEVIILDFFRIEALLKEKSVYTSKLIHKGYEVLDEKAERLLLLRN